MVRVATTHYAPFHRKSAGKPEVRITNKEQYTTVEPIVISTIFQCPGPHYLGPQVVIVAALECDICEIPTLKPMFSGSPNPMELLVILPDTDN